MGYSLCRLFVASGPPWGRQHRRVPCANEANLRRRNATNEANARAWVRRAAKVFGSKMAPANFLFSRAKKSGGIKPCKSVACVERPCSKQGKVAFCPSKEAAIPRHFFRAHSGWAASLGPWVLVVGGTVRRSISAGGAQVDTGRPGTAAIENTTNEATIRGVARHATIGMKGPRYRTYGWQRRLGWPKIIFLTNISGNGRPTLPCGLGPFVRRLAWAIYVRGQCTGEPTQDFLKFVLAIIGRHHGPESEWRTSEGRDRRPPIRSSSLSIEIALVADPETARVRFRDAS